jgi:ComF family protein
MAAGAKPERSGAAAIARSLATRVVRSAARTASDTLDVALPRQCAWCEADLDESARDARLCGACVAKLARPVRPRCSRCAAPAPAAATGAACRDCGGRRLAFEAVWTLGDYHDELREAVLATKPRRGEPLAWALADLLWRRHGEAVSAWRPSVVTYVPMHWRRRFARRANAPELIAASLARRLAVDCRKLATRRRPTRHQGDLTRVERQRNVRGAFRLAWGRPPLTGKRVLLVDDILTTGATANEVARVLRKAGAEAVRVAIVARTTDIN